MTGLRSDVVGALRLFRRAPAFAFVVVLTVGIGVGGVTAVFSVVRGVVLSPLSFQDSERVVALWGRTAVYPQTPLTVGDYNALVEGISAFETVAGSWGNSASLLGDAEPEQVGVGWVSPSYFPLLGVQPTLGRTLGTEDLNAILIGEQLTAMRRAEYEWQVPYEKLSIRGPAEVSASGSDFVERLGNVDLEIGRRRSVSR